MFEHHLHHVHEVAGTQLGVPSCIHHYVWLRWTRLDIMALAPLLPSKETRRKKILHPSVEIPNSDAITGSSKSGSINP